METMIEIQEPKAASAPATRRELAGRVALVTGAGRGLGECISRTLAEAGAAVVLADIRRDWVQSATEKIQKAGGKAKAVVLDVTNYPAIQAAMKAVVDEFGRLDILINNAGINVTESVDNLSVDDWNRILAVNLSGPFLTSKAAFPIMRHQKTGNIVNVVSTAAKRAWANASAYHASKWGLLGLSHALHVEARKMNVKVTSVVAGGMRTPFLLEPFPDIDVNTLQDPMNVAQTIRSILSLPKDTVIPEVMVIPMTETSWP